MLLDGKKLSKWEMFLENVIGKCLNQLKLDIRIYSLQDITIVLCLVMTLALISFFAFSSLTMLLLVFHLEYHCIVLWLIRLTNCLKMGWSLHPKRYDKQKIHDLVKKLKYVVLSYTLLIQTLVCNILLMIFTSNWIEQMFSCSKWEKYISLQILRSIYFAIFDSYLSYGLVWAQNCSTIQRIVRIIDFQPWNFHTSPLFKQNSILKFQDKICSENISFMSKSFNNLTPSVFHTQFSFSSDRHDHETSNSTQGNLRKLFHKTNIYGKYSITVSAIEWRNKIQKQLKDLSSTKTKTIVGNFCLKSY